MPRSFTHALDSGLISLLITCGIQLLAPASVFAVEIPSGIITENQTWSGNITISRDVTIMSATITIEPGTTIRFTGPPNATAGPVLRLSSPAVPKSPAAAQARLVMLGTDEEPILVETLAGRPPGRIAADGSTTGSLVAEHVIFRRLGQQEDGPGDLPALVMQLTWPNSDVYLNRCRFESCGPLRIETIGTSASLEINRCDFEGATGPAAVEIIGTGTGVKVVRHNVMDSLLRVECPQILVEENVLIGNGAGIVTFGDQYEAIRYERNYIHNTREIDDGGYCLRCKSPDAIARQNVMRGGTYVIESAPRRVSENVLIGVAGLEAQFGVVEGAFESATTTTHYLIANLPGEAIVTDNILAGPAYASMVIAETAESPRIKNNLFDGFNAARRAIEFNPMGTLEAKASIIDNTFMRYTQSPIHDHKSADNTIIEARGNVFIDVVSPAYDSIAGVEELPAEDTRIPDDQTEARLRKLFKPAATQPAETIDQQLKQRELTVEHVWRTWRQVHTNEQEPREAPIE